MSQESYPPGCHTVPTASAVDPDTGVNDDDAVALTVTGDDLWSGSRILFDGAPLATTWNGTDELSATVDLTGYTAGTVDVVVKNGNRRLSDALEFEITEPEE